ncbi:hypothetical protein QYM36_011451, partial [Artemia franciscana]
MGKITCLLSTQKVKLVVTYAGSGVTMPYWDFMGSTVITNSYIRLTPDLQSKSVSQFRMLKSLDVRNFIIFAHPLSLCSILQAGEKLGMFTRRFSWIVFSKVRNLPNCKVERAQFLYAGADLMKTSLTRDKQLSSSETMNPVDFVFWNLVSRSIVGAFRSTKDDGSTKLPWNSDVCSTGNFLATPADAKEKLGKFSDKLAMDKSFRRSYDMDYVFQ